MKKITINLTEDNYNYLKTGPYTMTRNLNDLLDAVRTTDIRVKPTLTGNKIINLYDMPENTTIHSKPEKPKTPEEIQEENIAKFKKLAKQILGHEVENVYDDLWLEPTNRYYDFAPSHEAEGKYSRWAYELPYDKQLEFLNEWKAWEDHENNK